MVLFHCPCCNEAFEINALEASARRLLDEAAAHADAARGLEREGEALSKAAGVLVSELGLLANV